MPVGEVPITFEDFYPLSDTTALVVTGGEWWADASSKRRDYMHNKFVVKLSYTLNYNTVQLGQVEECVVSGTHLRLGNYFESKLCYSDNYKIYYGDGEFLGEGEQPFLHETGLYYTLDSKIWKDGNLLIPLFNMFTEVCHPTISGNWIYFECLLGHAPGGWQVWKQHIKTQQRIPVMAHGANPYVFEDYLYFSYWDKSCMLLKTNRTKLPEESSAV